MKYLFSILGILILACTGPINTSLMAQDAEFVDSLLQQTRAENDSVRVRAYRQLAWHHMRYDLDLAEIYAKKVQEVGAAVDVLYYHALSCYYLGLIDRVRGDFLGALDYFEIAESFYAADTIYQLSLINTYYQLGTVYQQINLYDKALEYLLKELAWAETQKDSQRIAANYNAIGIVYKDMKQMNMALVYYDNAIELARRHDYSAELSNSLSNKAQVFEIQGHYEEVLNLVEEAFIIDSRDNYEQGMAHGYEMMGRAKAQLGDLPQALLLVKKAYDLSEKLGMQELLASNARSISEVYFQAKRYSEALFWAIKAEELAREIKDLQGIRDGQALLSQIYFAKEMYREVADLEYSINILDDSLYTLLKINLASQLEAKYRLNKKEGEISRLRLENELNTLNLEKEKAAKRLLWIGLGLLLFSSILIIRILQLQVQSNKLNLEKQQILSDQELLNLRQESKVLALTSMMEGQDEERNRIAQDLHDGLGGLLSTIRSQFENLQNTYVVMRDIPIYQKTKTLVLEACDEIRRISHDMMPPSLKVLGLANAIQDLGLRLHSKNLSCEVNIVGRAYEVNEHKELMIYRVVQELCHNVVKHAQAKSLLIQLHYNKEELVLLIEDDGRGFDVKEESGGIGLKSVYSRIEYLKGSIDIYSKHNVGTSVHINVPV